MKDVKKLFKIIAISISVLSATTSICQNTAGVNLNTKVKIGTNPVRFDSLVKNISNQTKAQFSFNTRKIAPGKIFILKKGEQSLGNVLQEIRNKTGIYYKIIGSHIILLDKQPQADIGKPTSYLSKPPSLKQKTATTKISVRKNSKITNSKYGFENKVISDTEDILDDETETTATAAADYLPVEDTFLQASANEKSISSDLKINEPAKQKLKDDTVGNQFPALIDTSTVPKTTITKQTERATAKTTRRGNGREASKNGKSLQFFVGAELLRTTDLNDGRNSNLNGYGINIKLERPINKKFSGTGSFGIAHFSGRYTTVPFNPFPSGDSAINNFTLTPLLAGVRYKLGAIVYLSAEGGITFKNKVNDRLLPIIAPSAGVL
ncbi:MAG: hypothetical protein ACQUYJ_19490, partial [Ferruginibacter sp.]